MNEVPEIISTKDLSYIEDMLNWNFITIKKINSYLSNITDSDVKELLSNVGDTYKKHYVVLLNCLNIGGTNE